MGVSIDVHVYDIPGLIKEVEEHVAKAKVDLTDKFTPDALLELIMPQFGRVVGNEFFTLWNEYYEDYSAATEFLCFIDGYYGTEDFYADGYETFGSANRYEVAEELGIELSDVVDDDYDY